MKRTAGFTLIELLVVMAIVASLLSIVAPRYIHRVDMAKEAALAENLSALRLALDQFYSDTGDYPERLEELVARQYLRKLPFDPVTGVNTSWALQVREAEGGRKVIYDVRSGATGNAMNGMPFKSW